MNFNLQLSIWMWRRQRAQFYRDAADAVSRSVGMREFFSSAVNTLGMVGDEHGKRVMTHALKRMSGGNTRGWGDVLGGIVPASDQLLLTSIDASPSDKRALALSAAADAIEFKQSIGKVIAWHAAQPIASIVVVGFICVTTAGAIASITKSIDNPDFWQGFNGFIKNFADSLLTYWPHVLVGLVVALAMLIWQLPRWTGALRLKADKLPIFGMYRDFQGAMVLSSLSVLLSNGKNITDCIRSLKSKSSPWLRWQLDRMNKSLVDMPTHYVLAMNRGLFAPKVVARIASLMNSGTLEDSLMTMGRKEVSVLKRQLELVASLVSNGVTYAVAAVAVVLTFGMMAISSSMNDAADGQSRPAAALPSVTACSLSASRPLTTSFLTASIFPT